MIKKATFNLFLATFVALLCVSASRKAEFPYAKANYPWADSVFKTLTPDERIAQLFMVAAYSNKKQDHVADIKKLITDYKIGGLIFFQGGPVREAILTNEYQSLSKVPLLVSIDGEWGLAMRLDSTPQYPRQMALGAIQNDSLIYEMGKQIAYECKRIGIQVNLAPVADINNNPLNPVISTRSFGEDKTNVARKAIAYMKGMQDAGVMANAKHFPGHGDTDSDSHKTLPIITHSKERIDTLELYPFKEMMKEGLGSLMVAHLFIPTYDSTPNTASTLSKAIVTDLLKNQLQFKGLVFTDALNMKGVSKFYEPGKVDVKALLAGNDVLLFAENVATAITEIKRSIEAGEITQEEIDARCLKILRAKEWCGLNSYKPIDLKNITSDINSNSSAYINRKLTEAAVTLLKNKRDIIPLKALDTLKLATLSLGYNKKTKFQDALSMYAPMNHYALDKEAKKPECDSLIAQIAKSSNLLVVQINNTNNSPKRDFGITPAQIYTLKALRKKMRVVVNIAANPYALGKIPDLEDVDAVLLSYEDTDFFQEAAADLVFGGIGATAKLPVTSTPYFKRGMGIETKAVRLRITSPEESGMDSKTLQKIDTIALKGIREKAYPGCQVFVARDGKIVYHKAFGYQTYDTLRKVLLSDLYDIASVTKIASSTAALMRLVSEKKVSIDKRLGDYLPELKGTNKDSILIREMLAHQAGLRDWIPFWQRTVDKGKFKEGIYDTVKSDGFPFRVADKLFIRKDFPDTLYNAIVTSTLKEPQHYKYSDLGYYFIKRIIEKETGLSLDKYVDSVFYKPLGLATMGYHPRDRFSLDRIVPTENDKLFRKQVVHGFVHDPGAAMMGGVGGHAGLFSNAYDLGVMMQLFLNKGEYGGQKFLDSTVVNEFTRCQYCVNKNRRGVGFDKPDVDNPKDSPVCECVSYLSFGHQGFTGTLAWADPEKKLVYVFLSNRVYPDAEPNKLLKLGTRSRIQEVIYEAIKK